jgi:cell division protein FtsB
MPAGRRPSAGRTSTGAGDRPGARSRQDGRPGVRPRPAARNRSGGDTSRVRGTVLRRAAVFAGVMVVLAVLLAPALRSYVAQQQQIAALKQHVADQRATVADLEQQRAAWNDPAYIKAQARSRLKFVMPGERAYNVIDAPNKPVEKASPVKAATRTVSGDRPWFGDLWRSVQIADAGQEAAASRAGS